MRDFEDYRRILSLHEQGFNKSDIERQTGIPHSTIRKVVKRFSSLENLYALQLKYEWRKRLNEQDYRQQYAYLLGLYLGDGHIIKARRSYKLTVSLDARYPNIVQSCVQAVQKIIPYNSVYIRSRKGANCNIVSAYSNDWTEIFPQHGEGAKHERRIVLETWQREIVDQFPIEFGRGLYHSDGTRIEPVINGKIYPRYEFTNVSPDIFKMFCDTVEKLGLTWTSHGYRITIARSKHVEYLDSVWGRKS